MLIRVVRMTFQPTEVARFLAIFEASAPRISAFPGCMHVELWQDDDNPAVFCTYSHWESAMALDSYRQSAFFQETWANTKVLFADRPLAFSVRKVTQQ